MLDNREYMQFLTQAQIKLPGASENGIKAELYDVMKEFFTDSGSWREDIMLSAVANTTTYLLTPSAEGQIIRLVGVWDDKGVSIPAYMPEFGTLVLAHPPNSTPPAGWTVRVEKTVTLPTVKNGLPIAPAFALTVYSVSILDGLIGKMMAQVDKSYSNPTMSSYHLRRFRTAIQMARTATRRDNLVGGQEWSYPALVTKGTQRGGVSAAWPTSIM
jgi:hypothetical protein